MKGYSAVSQGAAIGRSPALEVTRHVAAPTCYIGASWAIHAALGSITPNDRETLGKRAEELVVTTLSASGLLGPTFTASELADASQHPGTHMPLTASEVDIALAAGMRARLLKTRGTPNEYMIAKETLREHIVALRDWLADLPYLVHFNQEL